MRRRGAQYMYHHEKSVRFEPKFKLNKCVFVHKTSLASTQNTAHGMATASYNKNYSYKAAPILDLHIAVAYGSDRRRRSLQCGVSTPNNSTFRAGIQQQQAGIRACSAEQLIADVKQYATLVKRSNVGRCGQ